MAITAIHTYLVNPTKRGADPGPIPGAEVTLSGKMFDLLAGIYNRSELECNVAISFEMQQDGKQKNECRDLIVKYAEQPTAEHGEYIAKRLATYTDNRSGMGLLFLITGNEGKDQKVMACRFPADSGFLAEQNSGGLNVEFLEKIFMKSARSYKSVVYKDTSFKTGFWRGQVVDRQINDGEVSDYWIVDFLASSLFTTPAAGTQRLARAFKAAALKATAIEVKEELAAAMKLAPGQDGKTQTTNQILEKLGLSRNSVAAVKEHLSPNALVESFKFEAAEFKRHITFQTMELNNGALVSALAENFEDVFQIEQLDESLVRISTEGSVKDIRIGKMVR